MESCIAYPQLICVATYEDQYGQIILDTMEVNARIKREVVMDGKL